MKFNAFRDYELDDVNRAASRYHQLLAPLGDQLTLPIVADHYTSSWAQYTIQLADGIDRSQLQATMKEKGIPTMVYYPKTMSQQSAFAQTRRYVDTPQAQRLCQQVLALPIHPYITEEEQQTVVDALQKALQ